MKKHSRDACWLGQVEAGVAGRHRGDVVAHCTGGDACVEVPDERPKEPVKYAEEFWPSDESFEAAIEKKAFLQGAHQALMWLRTQTVLMHHSNGYPSPAVPLAAINEEITRVEKAMMDR